MSYDFHVETDRAGYREPAFSDRHPALGSDGVAGTVMLVGDGCGRCGNYTSNVSPMWTKCLTAALEQVPGARALCGTDDRYVRENWGQDRPIRTDSLCLRDLNGARCEDLAPLLAAAVEWGIEHVAELREDNPENGWGNAEGAITYLWDIQRACEQEPRGRLRISS